MDKTRDLGEGFILFYSGKSNLVNELGIVIDRNLKKLKEKMIS